MTLSMYSLTKHVSLLSLSFFTTCTVRYSGLMSYFISAVSKGTVVHNLNAWQITDDFPIRRTCFVHLQLWYMFYCTAREKWLIWH